MSQYFTTKEYAAICTALQQMINRIETSMHFYEEYEKESAKELIANAKKAMEKIIGEGEREWTTLLN